MADGDNPARERILSRVRAAVHAPAPLHRVEGAPAEFFARVADPLERFQKECAANITECVVVPNLAHGAETIDAILTGIPPGEIFLQDTAELQRIFAGLKQERPVHWSTEGPPHESSQATITMCEALVALTGSVLVSSGNGGRAATVIAPVHIVVASLAQLVPDLDAAFARIEERGIARENSYLSLITGSSRTADIEKILVMGAHGPKKLVVVVCREFK
jgi:L-lactate utilization protein LutC